MKKRPDLSYRPPATEDALKSLQDNIPLDHIEFLRFSDGASGLVGHQHLILYSVDEIVSITKQYSEFVPNLTFVGSDGGGLGYAYDCRKRSYVEIHFMDVGDEHPRSIAPTLDLLISNLETRS